MNIMSNTIMQFLFVAHVFLSLSYFFIISLKNKSQALSEFLIAVTIPGFGLAFLLAVKSARFLRLAGEDPSYMYRQFQNNRPMLGQFAWQETNIIPLEDLLALDDTKTKRAMLGDVIKKNILNNNELLFKAVRDPDSEVSHYAVSVVTNKIEKLESLLFHSEKKLAQAPTDIEALKEYADTMGDYLRMGFLDEISQKKNEKIYVNVLETLLSLDTAESKYFIEKISYEMVLKNYEKAETFCEMFLRHFPDNENPYIMYIKLYWQLKNYHKLQEKIKQLKASPIRLTINALELIRFWDGGGQRA